ncbi:MAG TPA: hypothetical protein VK601_31415, partial [Kofleriaceae bacterium]|nr:hypothetical protein [Kofleriaceae bacterium]
MEAVAQAIARGAGAGAEYHRAAPEPLADERVVLRGGRQVERERIAGRARVLDQVRVGARELGQPRLHQLLDPLGVVAGRHHVGMDPAAHQRRVVGAGVLGVGESRHHDADLR